MGKSGNEFLEQREREANNVPVKKSLYNIESEYMELMERILDADGEITDEIQTALAINEKELTVKSQGYVSIIKKMQAENAFIDSEVKRLQGLKKSREALKQRLEDNIEAAMNLYGIEKIELPLNKISFRKSERVEIDCEAEDLPKKLQKIKIEPISKTEIKAMIKAGESFNGVRLVECKNLQIK